MRTPLLALALLVPLAGTAGAAAPDCGVDTEVVSGCPVLAPGDYAEIAGSNVVEVEPFAAAPRPTGSGCTLGVLLADPRGARYFTYAGHCATGATPGARVLDRGGHLVGTLVYAVYDHDQGRDVAIVKVAQGRRTDPAVRGVGGPTGLLTTTAPAGPVEFSGSSAPGAVAHARSSTTTGIGSGFTFRLGPEPVPGDSGSPVLLPDGRVAGEFIGYLNGSGDPSGEDPQRWVAGPTYAFRMDRQLALASAALRTRLRLLTAPLA
jgi:hypothetical protein